MDPPNITFPVTIDGVQAAAVLDLRQPSSFMSGPFSVAMWGHAYGLRRVAVPSMTSDVSYIGMQPCSFEDPRIQILLGRDWFYSVSVFPHVWKYYSTSSGASSVPLSHLDSLFNWESVSLFSNCNERFVIDACAMHGLTDFGYGETNLKARLIRHLLSGMCAGNEYPGCTEVARQSRTNQRGPLASYCVSRLLQQGNRYNIDSALALSCAILFPYIAVSDEDRNVDRAALLLSYSRAVVLLFERAPSVSELNPIDVENLHTDDLRSAALAHGLRFDTADDDELRRDLLNHLLGDTCSEARFGLRSDGFRVETFEGCQSFDDDALLLATGFQWRKSKTCALRFHEVERLLGVLGAKSLRHLASILGIASNARSRSNKLRADIAAYLRVHRKGKTSEWERLLPSLVPSAVNVEDPSTSWPRVASDGIKKRVLSLFRRATGKDALQSFSCAVCGENKLVNSERLQLMKDELDLSLLDVSRLTGRGGDGRFAEFERSDTLNNLALNRRGLSTLEGGVIRLDMCRDCHACLRRGKLPSFALANDMVLGDVPEALRGLTPVEEALIARCRAKSWIVHLRESDVKGMAQRGMKGHVIVYPQHPEGLRNVLPPPVEDLQRYICVVFVGSQKPSQSWFNTKASPLLVRQEKIRRALQFLKQANPLYADVEIDEGALSALPENAMLPFRVQHKTGEGTEEMLTDRYDGVVDAVMYQSRQEREANGSDQIVFDSVVVTDVDENTSLKDKRLAAMRHLRTAGKGHVAVPHDLNPVNEFRNPELFPMMYPTLFPYGRGGFDSTDRPVNVSTEAHIRHLLHLTDSRFQEHFSFIFVAFNMMQ